MTSFYQFNNKMRRCRTVEQLGECLKEKLKTDGITSFVFTCYYRNGRENNRLVEYAYMSESYRLWHNHYHEQDYDSIDTTNAQALLDNLPQLWTIEEQIANAKTKREQKMRLDSLEFGADCGLCIPIYRGGNEHAVFLVSQMQGEAGLRNWQEKQYDFLTIGHVYYHYLRKQLLKEQSDNAVSGPQINSRQKQCFKLIDQSHTVEDIAKVLNITERTVNYHIQKTNKLFSSKNKYVTLARIKELGLID